MGSILRGVGGAGTGRIPLHNEQRGALFSDHTRGATDGDGTPGPSESREGGDIKPNVGLDFVPIHIYAKAKASAKEQRPEPTPPFLTTHRDAVPNVQDTVHRERGIPNRQCRLNIPPLYLTMLITCFSRSIARFFRWVTDSRKMALLCHWPELSTR